MEAVVVPTLIDDGKQLDLLGRQEFVDKLKDIALILSKNRKNVCYAINGGWGVGKSFA